VRWDAHPPGRPPVGPPWAAYGRGTDFRGPPAWLIVPPLLFVQLLGTQFAADEQTGKRALDLLGYGLLSLGPVALAWRRRYAVAVLGLVFAVTMLYLGLNYPYGPVFFSLAVALFSAIVRGHRWPGLVFGLLTWLGAVFLGPLLGHDARPAFGPAGAVAAWTIVVIVAGEFAHAQRGRVREMWRTREEEGRRIASEERLRIARELHDVLAHNISLTNVQAGVALHLMDEQPEQARTALTTIKSASQETLSEMRSVLGVLRDVDETAPRTPTTGLSRLAELVGRMTDAGLDVIVTTMGEARRLPAGVDLAAYRIVQESLTNVRRHVGPVPVKVSLDYRPTELEVLVQDDGLPDGVRKEPPMDGTGNGIPGMRERAEALGGSLEAGPLPGGGFRVRTVLPLAVAGAS
jgi:signal transduction histidine kinase